MKTIHVKLFESETVEQLQNSITFFLSSTLGEVHSQTSGGGSDYRRLFPSVVNSCITVGKEGFIAMIFYTL